MPAAAFEQTCTRIASALQVLIAEESLALRAGNLSAAEELQERAAPLVDFISAHAGHVREARAVIAALRAQRGESSGRLAADLTRLRDQLCALELSRRHLSRIGPAYTAAAGATRRLISVG